MNAPLRIAAFGVALIAIFAFALLVGRTVGPIGDPATGHHNSAPSDSSHGGHPGGPS